MEENEELTEVLNQFLDYLQERTFDEISDAISFGGSIFKRYREPLIKDFLENYLD